MTTCDIDSCRKDSLLRAGCARLRREFWDLLAACSPAKRRQRMQWVKEDGVEFLRAIGLREGNTVVDFGCGSGAYSIVAAKLAGEGGMVVSVDRSAWVLNRLMRRADAEDVHNIRTARDPSEVRSILRSRPCRGVLLYDVLHFMDKAERKKLYDALRGLLETGGILSVHPKHVQGDKPSRHFRHTTVDDVVQEIEETGFRLCDRREMRLWHGHGCVKGVVLIFRAGNEVMATGPAKPSSAKLWKRGEEGVCR